MTTLLQAMYKQRYKPKHDNKQGDNTMAKRTKSEKADRPMQVQVTFPKKDVSKALPAILTLQPDVKPEAVSGFINRLLFDKDFRNKYAKDPVAYMRELGIKVDPADKGDLVKVDISDEFMRVRPDTEEPQAAAAVVAAIVAAVIVVAPTPVS